MTTLTLNDMLGLRLRDAVARMPVTVHTAPADDLQRINCRVTISPTLTHLMSLPPPQHMPAHDAVRLAALMCNQSTQVAMQQRLRLLKRIERGLRKSLGMPSK